MSRVSVRGNTLGRKIRLAAWLFGGISLLAGLSCCNPREEGIKADYSKQEPPKTTQLSPPEREIHVLKTMLGEYQRLKNGSPRDRERAALLKPRLIERRQKIKQRSKQDATTKSLLQDLDKLEGHPETD